MGDLVLAPMDSYTDLPFRTIAKKHGAALIYTEFINAVDILHKNPYVRVRLEFGELERPIAIQIYDNDVDRIIKTALKVRENNPDIIDINMGCSAKRIAARRAGVGLMLAPHKVARIFSQLTKLLDIPITGKIRLGWDPDDKNYMQIARIVEENGGSLLAIHGRTRDQAYRGEADWDPIAEVKQTLSIPVIGNGDVRTISDIGKIKAHTNCDAVMIGRAAIGNPWMFSRIEKKHISSIELVETIKDHLTHMISVFGPERGLRAFRKHSLKYLDLMELPRDLRKLLMTRQSEEEFLDVLMGKIVPIYHSKYE
jgi:tRNA-dihydrouridine synthase B